jgi:hypothetical protein
MSRILLTLFLAVLAAAQPRTPVVVELFTSEGCSSCPPADNLLSRLEQFQPYAGVEVIALGEHVDYWNQLGWQDRFSSPMFSERQQAYGRAFRLESVYTPEVVVNGQAEFLGTDQMRIQREIEKAAQGPKARIDVSMLSSDTLRLKVDSLPPGTQESDILLVVTEAGLESNVQRGENGGRQLRHAGVVRSLVRVGHLDARKAGAYSADAKLRLSPEWRRENLKLVLFVQDRVSRKILGAASMRL